MITNIPINKKGSEVYKQNLQLFYSENEVQNIIKQIRKLLDLKPKGLNFKDGDELDKQKRANFFTLRQKTKKHKNYKEAKNLIKQLLSDFGFSVSYEDSVLFYILSNIVFSPTRGYYFDINYFKSTGDIAEIMLVMDFQPNSEEWKDIIVHSKKLWNKSSLIKQNKFRVKPQLNEYIKTKDETKEIKSRKYENPNGGPIENYTDRDVALGLFDDDSNKIVGKIRGNRKRYTEAIQERGFKNKKD